MLRQATAKLARPALRLAASSSRSSSVVAARTFSVSALRMAEGDTGAPPAGGQMYADAFQKRERANEDWAIRQREKEKLLELKAKLAEQQAHLQQLAEHIDELTKEQGGEHN